jgi:hypothetical protein
MGLRSRIVMLTLASSAIACGLTNLDDLRGSGDAATESGSDASMSIDASTDSFVHDDTSDAPTANQIKFVQSTANDYGSGDLSFPMAVIDGHAVIVVVANSVPGSVNVTDSSSNIYARVFGPYAASESGTLQIFAAFGVKGFTTMHISPPDGGTGYIDYAAEYIGITKFDNYATGSSASTGTDGLATSSVATTADPELLFAYAEALGDVDAGSGFFSRSGFDGNTIEERIVTTPNNYEATATIKGGQGDIVLTCFH